MFTMREFMELEAKVVKLEREAEKSNRQTARNTALSKKCEMFREKLRTANGEIETLKLKRESKVKFAVGLIIDKLISLTDQQVADRLFVNIAYINNTKSAIKRERK